MAKKKETMNETTKLKIPREKFKSQLRDRINIGREILSRAPQANASQQDSYYRMGIRQARDYDHQFSDELRKWSDYNDELLKQAFTNPNNEYRRAYTSAGQPLIITSNEDIDKDNITELDEKIKNLQRLHDKVDLIETIATEVDTEVAPVTSSNRVFVVHGHDSELRTNVELLITKLGYQPVVLFKEANGGKTIIEKFEDETNDVAFAVVLYTSCDIGADKTNEAEMKPRARQNVVFEHGYMCAKLGRSRVCAVVENGVEVPGDMSGVVYVQYDDKGMWQMMVAKEMKAAGLNVDLNKIV